MDMSPANSEAHKDAKDLVQGALVNYLGMFAKISKIGFLLIAARLYGTPALGLYILAWNTIDLASKFGLWGIDRTMIRDIARYRTEDSPATNARIYGILRFNIALVLCLSFVTACWMYILSPFIAMRIFHDQALIIPLRVLTFAIPFVTLTHVLIAATKGLRIMKYEVLIRHGLESLLLMTMALALTPLKLGAVGLVSAHLLASAFATGAAALAVFRQFKYLGAEHPPLPKSMKKEILRFTSPMAAMDFLTLMVARIDIILVGAMVGTTSAGFYGIAVEIISVIKKVRQGFEPILYPIVAELLHYKKKERLKRNYVIVTRWLAAGTLLPALVIFLMPVQILSFFSKEATEAAWVLVILAAAHGLIGIFSAAESLLIMAGKTMLNTGLAGLMLLINISVSLLLIPEFGAVGAALGMLAAYSFATVARVYKSYSLFRLHPFAYPLLWPLATFGITLTACALLMQMIVIDSSLETLLVLGVIVLVYAGIYISGATEPEEIQSIESLKKKLKKWAVELNRYRRMPTK